MQVARKSKNKEELWLGLLLVAKKIREKRSIKKLAVINHLATSVPIVSTVIHTCRMPLLKSFEFSANSGCGVGSQSTEERLCQ